MEPGAATVARPLPLLIASSAFFPARRRTLCSVFKRLAAAAHQDGGSGPTAAETGQSGQ